MSMMSAGSGMAFDLLWKNSSPTASFSARTISVPGMSKYEAVLVGFDAKSVGGIPGGYVLVDLRNATSGGTGGSYVYWGSSQGRNVEGTGGRTFTIKKETEQVSFLNRYGAERTGTMNNSNNYFSTNNNSYIPAYIWGLKKMPKLEGVEA